MTGQHHVHATRGLARHRTSASRFGPAADHHPRDHRDQAWNRGQVEPAHAARLLAIADQLFEEFDALPVLTVIRSMITARRILTGRPDGDAPAEDIYRFARAELSRLERNAHHVS